MVTKHTYGCHGNYLLLWDPINSGSALGPLHIYMYVLENFLTWKFKRGHFLGLDEFYVVEILISEHIFGGIILYGNIFVGGGYIWVGTLFAMDNFSVGTLLDRGTFFCGTLLFEETFRRRHEQKMSMTI